MSLIGGNRSKAPRKGAGKRNDNNRIYANPLPIIFSDSSPSRVRSILGLVGLSLTQVITPHCEGYFDPHTRSVWTCERNDSMLLWRRGFFGKGDLSRSEPTWLARRLNDRKARQGKYLTSEEIREKRRAERRQFKLDRAAAIAAVAAEAEAIFEAEGRVVVPALSGPEIPSGATWRPAPVLDGPTLTTESREMLEDQEPLEDVEHLQLTLHEAFFLSWNLDCLDILHPETDEPMTLREIWVAFQHAYLTPPIPDLPTPQLQFDNPFLIHYVAYHHYRSLGWVVKGGIKFCVDYLLYKKGPVFTHAEFAIVVCPVYEDLADQETSTTNLQNAEPFNWHWLSTINRVNSQVMKTLILTYVTIPARSRISSDVLSSPACLAQYSVREVIVRRFIPARMRD
ncbi:hypothetical protein K435DRAFT_673986 [Dendrothele bispora CBS 962.96]|uniref:tRNA-splicing endonuclease subunit Sen2 n=1 Tax=Dendrothele bispora (strain CBS 962.96) TaxID=1314807 RepID=A0A4S8LQK5_DENBC|nr:hypothetical protein K435DRAFT_673986 [Dendrothele bispora CBS 962.96]